MVNEAARRTGYTNAEMHEVLKAECCPVADIDGRLTRSTKGLEDHEWWPYVQSCEAFLAHWGAI